MVLTPVLSKLLAIGVRRSFALDGFADLVLHQHRAVFLHDEPAGSDIVSFSRA